MVKIFNSTYAKSDLNQVDNKITELNSEERTQLLSLLEDSEDLLNGTLGYWTTEPVDLDLKPGFKPLYSRYYTLPIINKETLFKELRRLVEIGVLTPVQQNQYGTPIFIIPNKEGTVRFITEYHRLNHKLARKPYPLPRISETMQQLEVFQYKTALDLKMVYYTVSISPASQEMTTIVT